MLVAVVGAGAMGSLYAGAFSDSGNDVLLVDANPAVVEAINTKGLAIERRDGTVDTYRPRATSSPQSEREADLVLFMVKGFQTKAAATLAAPLVGEGTIVATLQNGLGNGEILAAAYQRAPVVGISLDSAAVVSPGRVAHTAAGPTYVGPYAGEGMGAARRVAAALEGSGFEVHELAECQREIWKKLVLNSAALPVAALTRLDAAGMAQDEFVFELVEQVARETLGVARAAGHDIDPDEHIAYIRGVLVNAGRSKASMLQDALAGRRTEVDTLTGAVIRTAEQLGLSVPLNRALYALIKGFERASGVVS